MKNKVNLIISLLLILSCKTSQEKETKIETNQVATVDTLWSVSIGGSISPFIFNNQVIVSRNLKREGEIVSFNKLTGKENWIWYDYLQPIQGLSELRYFVINNTMIIADGPRNYAINLDNGTTIWRNQMPGYFATPTIYTDQVGFAYQSYTRKDGRCDIYATEIKNGKRKIQFTIIDSSNLFNEIVCYPITHGKNSKNEELIILNANYFHNSENRENKIEVYAIEKASGKVVWRKNYGKALLEILPQGFCSVNGITLAFGFGFEGEKLIAISNDNGEIIWEKSINDFGSQIIPIGENVIVTLNGFEPIYMIRSKTGDIVWQQPFDGITKYDRIFSSPNATLFNHQLILTFCSRIMSINIGSGQITYFKKMAILGGCLYNGTCPDKDSNILFAVDQQSIIAYKLPKEIK